MKASFIIFVLIQIAAECRSANLPRMANKSDVIWVTDELPSEEITNSESVEKVAAVEDFVRTLKKIEEIMLGEVSSNDHDVQSDDPGDSNFNLTQYDLHARYKANRCIEVEKLLYNFTGHSPPNGTIPNYIKKKIEIAPEVVKKIMNNTQDVKYPTITQTIPAFCNQTLKENMINLHFHMTDTKFSSAQTIINVTSAWLRIYKFAPEKLNTTSLEPINFTLMYNNRTSLKKKPKKTIKLNPQYLQIDEERWIEWDVKEVVSIWLNEFNDTSKNFGKIRIKVADNEDHALPVHEFFNMKNCSKITELPVMLPFDDRNSNYMMFPHLNFTIQEIPRIDDLRKKLVESANAITSQYSLLDEKKPKDNRANENHTFNEPDSSK